MKQGIRRFAWLAVLALGTLAVSGHVEGQRVAPGPVAVQVTSAADDKPLGDVYVYLGGRYSSTTPQGTATFDGVPAGTYPLRIEHRGYERFEQRVELPAGKREPLAVKLVPHPEVNVTGQVTLEGDGRPLAGARVALVPVTVAAAVQGRLDFVCGWDGNFTALRLPPGKYRAEVSATGCTERAFDVDVQPEMAALAFSLQPASEQRTLRVRVLDAVSRAAIGGARVVLAEAWPRGIVAENTTGADGLAMLAGFQAGRLNWERMDTPTGMAGLWRRDHWLLDLRPGGEGLRGAYAHRGQCEGRLSEEGKLFTGRWKESVCEGAAFAEGRLTFQLSDDLTTLAGKWGYGEEEPGRPWPWGRISLSHVARCRVTATVFAEAEGYQYAVLPASLVGDDIVTVQLNPLTMIVEQEPNDELASAQAIRTGAPVQCKIDRAKDRDCFRFRLPYPATVRLGASRPGDMWAVVTLLRPDGATVSELGITDSTAYSDPLPLPSGDYILRARAWNEGQASDEPMYLRVGCEWAPDGNEPNDTPAMARPLRAGEEVRGTIHPSGDHDWFRFTVERPSHVRFVSAAHGIWRTLNVFDQQGTERGGVGISGGARDLVVSLEPGEFLLRVRQWNDRDTSCDPYCIRMEMAEDDWIDDTQQPQGGVLALRTLSLGSQVSNTIFPAGDHDYYRVAIPSAGRLHAWLTRPPEIWATLHLRDERGQELRGVGVSGEQGGLSWDFDGPRTVYLHLHEWNNTACSPNPYTLGARFEPCDELEVLGRNDTLDTAVPVELNEDIRANLMPGGDDDWYQVTADFAGELTVSGVQAPLWMNVSVLDARGKELVSRGFSGANAPFSLSLPVLAGDYYVRVREWNDSAAHVSPYSLRVSLRRAEYAEREPLREDPPRVLKLHEAQAFMLDQSGDHDRFTFDVPEAGKFQIRMRNPAGLWTTVALFDDRTGEKLAQWGNTSGGEWQQELEAKGPTRYRLEIREWNDSAVSPDPGWVMVQTQGLNILAEKVSGVPDLADPTAVSFTRAEVPGMARAAAVRLDADGDGNVDLEVPQDGAAIWRYRSEGLYQAVAWLEGDNGITTRYPFWVEAFGPRERRGVYAVVDRPSEGQVIDTDEPVRVRALSYTGSRIARVTADVDGQALPTAYNVPCAIEVPWRNLGAGLHTLTLTASDAAGEQCTVQRRFRVSEYFDLQPADGATVTGNAVRVAWCGGRFGPSVVRYRPRGEDAWQQAVGESGRDRVVMLKGLEAGKPYEFQPLGGTEPGPIRTVTRVKGLAFGRNRYGATINRDYDQRVPIAVRNHGDAPLLVNLVCGKPETPDLLLSFVGEGSEDRPIELGPGAEREFSLVFSAQDAVHPTYRIPLRITSTGGFSDEAEVEVNVRLPEVKLKWEQIGEDEGSLARRLRLTNEGDGLTDLALTTDTPELTVSPAVEHGIFPKGATMDVTVYPRLYEGFKAVEGTVIATAVGKSTPHPLHIALKEGQQVWGVWLSPGTEDAGDDMQADLMRARYMAGAYLTPAYVDWTKASESQDTNGDGKPDRWALNDEVEQVRWVGDDTNGDGVVDFAHGDIGFDGQFDWSGFNTENGWEETNLVDAQLEMGFSLRGGLESYQKHDVDLVMNGQLLGQLTDTIPQGNFTFPIPPTALKWNAVGSPEDNNIEILSRHLRGGHYAVTSDFRVKMRLTGARAWVVAASEEEAKQKIEGTAGVSLTAPDLSVSSEQMRIAGPPEPKVGDDLVVTVPVRNLGAAAGQCVALALMAAYPDGTERQLTRRYVEYIPAGTVTPVELACKAPAGRFNLKVVADPDKQQRDLDDSNNTAMVAMSVAGDEAGPTVAFAQPADGAVLMDTVLGLQVRASDDVRVAQVQVRVDGGLWRSLGPEGQDTYGAKALLQPGQHELTVRATDVAGNQVQQTVKVTVNAPVPEVAVVEPAEGATIDARQTTVRARVGKDTAVAAVRVAGSPWRQVNVQDGILETILPLRFGEAQIEVMAVNDRGAQRVIARTVTCSRQPEAPEEAAHGAPALGVATAAGEGLPRGPVPGGQPTPPNSLLLVEGFGAVDPFGSPNDVQEPAGLAASTPVITEAPAAVHAEAEEEEEPDAEPVELPTDEPEDEAIPNAADFTQDEWDDFVAQYGPLTEGPEDGQSGVAAGTFTLPIWDCPSPRQAPPQPSLAPSPGGLGPASGTRCVALQVRQCDWYCTNRPHIKVKFQLPDWLKRLNLPKPGTKEYDEMVKKLLAHLRNQGLDTAPLEKFQEALLRMARGLQSPEELPGWLQSIGFAGPKPTDEAGLKAWREAMENGVRAWWLRLLASGDPALIYQGLKARHEAMGQFDRATQEAAEAAMQMIQSYQQETEFWAYSALAVAGVVGPGLGTQAIGWALDIDLGLTALRGETLSGHQLSKWDYLLMGLLRFGPKGVEKALQSERAAPVITAIGNGTAWLGSRAADKLTRALGAEKAAKIAESLKYVWAALTKERSLRGSHMDVRANTAAGNAGYSPPGLEAEARLQSRIQDVDRLIKRFMRSKSKKDAIALDIQQNPDAVALLKAGKYPPEVADQIGTILQKINSATDKRTVKAILASPQGQAAAAKAAEAANRNPQLRAQLGRDLTPKDLGVRSRNITGSKGAKFGDDRDVMFEFFDKRTGQSVGAVDHEIAAPIYAEKFKIITGRNAADLHHEVTSPTHSEAFNLLKYKTPAEQEAFVRQILTGEAAGQHGWRGADLGQVVTKKVKDCFAEAAKAARAGDLKAADMHYTRGMRMALKEWERHAAPRLRELGLDPNVVLPPRLREFLQQAQRVNNGLLNPNQPYTVEQARAAMEAIKCRPQGHGRMDVTFDRAAEDLGAFIEVANRFGLPLKQ